MLDHPKWRRALRLGGDEVVATWVRLTSWCSRNLTDGRVPADVVAQVAEVRSVERSRALRALADAGLISFSHPSDAGLTAVSSGSDVVVTDYLQRNPSRSQVLEERARRSESQRKRRGSSPEAAPVTGHAPTSDPACNEVPARPGPISSTTTERARTDATPLHREASSPPNQPDSSPVVITEIPADFELDDELRAEAIAAGVKPSTIDERFGDLKRGPIGGRRGIFRRDLRDYIRRQFPKWRTWNETDSHQSRAGPKRSGSREHHQPDAGVDPWKKATVL